MGEKSVSGIHDKDTYHARWRGSLSEMIAYTLGIPACATPLEMENALLTEEEGMSLGRELFTPNGLTNIIILFLC